MNGILKQDRWTGEKRARLEKLRSEGMTWEVVAERCGHSVIACQSELSKIMKKRRPDHAPVTRKSRRPWRDDEVAEMIGMREQQKMLWTDIDRHFNRSGGTSCSKYESLRRTKEQVSKYGGGGRIDLTEVERDRNARRLLEHRTLTSEFFGDPLPGHSALDKKRAGIPDTYPPTDYEKAYEPRRPKITLSPGLTR